MASTVNDSELKKKFAKLAVVDVEIMKLALKKFVEVTPKRTGNAKSQTHLKNNVITAEYSYAFVLDGGRKQVGKKMQGSNQAPKGMTEPTKKEMVKIVKDQIIKAGK